MRKTFLLICLLQSVTSTLVTDESEVELCPEVTEVRRARSVSEGDNETRIITTIPVPPYLMLKNDADNREGNDRYVGFVADLTEQIAKIAGFKYELRLVADSSYGSVNSEGKWNGMIGELLNGQADMAIAPLTVTWEREKVVDFSNPIIQTGISIMIKKPERIPSMDNIFPFLNPFSTDIWLYTVIGYIGVSIVLFLISRFSPYERQGNVDDGPKPTQSDIAEPGTSAAQPKGTRNKCYSERLKAILNDFSNAFWFSWGAFVHQDVGFRPRSISGRITGLVWWIFVFVIASCYIANWAALLLTDSGYTRIKPPIESAEDLARQSEIKYGTLRNGSTSRFFKTSKRELYQRMWSVMQSDPSVFVDSVKEGVERVRESRGKYAFILESRQNDFVNMQRPCNTMKVGDNLMSTFFAIATPKGSALRHSVDYATLILRELGEIDMLQRKWWELRSECPLPRKRDGFYPSGLRLNTIFGLLCILIFGLVLALVVCVCEFLISRFLGNLCTR